MSDAPEEPQVSAQYGGGSQASGQDPERGQGGGYSGREPLIDEQLTRRRQARYAALCFIGATGALLIGVVISIICLLFRLFSVYTADSTSAQDIAQAGALIHLLPALPIFSLSVFALFVYVTLARFTRHFVSESTPRDIEREESSDDSVILAALDKVSRLFKQTKN